jgi:cystinosin
MGYFKVSISFLKWWPQMIWNFKRKSTKGWSTFANILDFIGGFFAFFQIWMEK